MTVNHIADMVCHMKTTLNIDDGIMERLKQEAARRGTTMSALVEAGLRRVLDDEQRNQRTPRRRKRPTWRSGGALVDVSDREALYGAMEDP